VLICSLWKCYFDCGNGRPLHVLLHLEAHAVSEAELTRMSIAKQVSMDGNRDIQSLRGDLRFLFTSVEFAGHVPTWAADPVPGKSAFYMDGNHRASGAIPPQVGFYNHGRTLMVEGLIIDEVELDAGIPFRWEEFITGGDQGMIESYKKVVIQAIAAWQHSQIHHLPAKIARMSTNGTWEDLSILTSEERSNEGLIFGDKLGCSLERHLCVTSAKKLYFSKNRAVWASARDGGF
jgi:hypothetical protein